MLLKKCLDSFWKKYYIINREIIQFAQAHNINLFLRPVIKMKIPKINPGFLLNNSTYLELTDEYKKTRDEGILTKRYLLQPINIGGYYNLYEKKLRLGIEGENPWVKMISFENE